MPYGGEQQEHLTTGDLQYAGDIHSLAATAVPLLLINWKLCLSKWLSLGPLAFAVLKGMLASLYRGGLFFFLLDR